MGTLSRWKKKAFFMKRRQKLVSLAAVVLTTLTSTGMAGVAFADTTQNDQKQTPVNTTLTAPTNTTNPIPPQPDGGGAGSDGNGTDSNNKNNQISGNFGIAYQPKSFSFSSNLNASGAQDISITNPNQSKNATYNVGVKDTLHNQKGWTLTAQLQWSGNKSIAGATINTTSSGKVMNNTNNGTSNFMSTDLKPVSTTEATGTPNLSINNSAQTVMSGTQGQMHNAIYDFDLGNITLHIPETSTVVADNYSGNVNWNLEMAAN
jgi:hypothetical protein